MDKPATCRPRVTSLELGVVMLPRTCMRIALLAIALTLLPGCLVIGSSKSNTNPPTLGQQLSDLKTAHDEGAINDAEYDGARTKLLTAN